MGVHERPAVPCLLLLCVTTVAYATETPVAVSPGSPAGTVVADECPTFSWGEVDEAQSYEIAVYRADDEGADLEPALRQSFPNSAYSWTPSIDLCFERGSRYVWSVRSYGRNGSSSDWSAANLFEVASGPSEAEFEEALDLVRRYLEPTDTPGSQAPVSLATAEPVTGADPMGSFEPTPQTHAGTGQGTVVINGAVAETKADPPCYPEQGAAGQDDRFVNCNNGTVLDTVTGLLWLEWANCRFCAFAECPIDDGLRSWYDANAFAASRQDGSCGLSDHSQAGDWRLPTKEEWEAIADTICSPPSIAGESGGCYGATGDGGNEWAWDVVSLGKYWSSSTSTSIPSIAWQFFMDGGGFATLPKTTANFVWPVRDGQ